MNSIARPVFVCVCSVVLLGPLLRAVPLAAADASIQVKELGGENPNQRDANQSEWKVVIAGSPMATFHADLEGTPGIYPLLTPSGIAVTRNYPMTEATEFERDDHPHHRSLWFTHGEVNGVDFWAFSEKAGRVVQTSADWKVENSVAKLTTNNEWLDADGNRVLTDHRVFEFKQVSGDNVIDFGVRLIASDGPLVFGDTKEGSFGIRVAGSMKVDSKLGGKVRNAEGLEDKAAWGKVSPWVDYSGPVGDQKAGVTIMAHPANGLPETYWHVRTYGLFAANPFGRRHFGQPAYDGYQLKQGETLELSYRVIVHDGDFDEAKAAKHFEEFSSSDAPIANP